MGKEKITVEIDAALMEKLRAAGLDPIQHVERLLARQAVERETPAERIARQEALRREMQPGLDAYDALIAEIGDWNADLRTF